MPDDREQLERLLSERPDGALDADERLVVERALKQDPSAAATAKWYERLQAVLRQWRPLGVDVDWVAMAQQTSERVAEVADREKYRQVDGLVQRWADSLPEVDWDRFKTRIGSAVRQEAARLGGGGVAATEPITEQARRLRWRRTAKWMATVGVPLAAAAVIVIAVWWPGAVNNLAPNGTGEKRSMVVVSLETPRSTGRISINFDETAAVAAKEPEVAGSAEGGEAQSLGGLAIASSPSEAIETSDEALFY